jgi:uncharacterized protein with HEPN domain
LTRRDDTVPMRHMLDHAREAIEFGGGKSPEEIEADRMLNLSLLQLLQIIGEAAHRVSQETRAKYPMIPRQKAIDMRNRLIDGYDTIDRRIVRDVIRDDLPPLVIELERVLEAGDGA